ncbi:extracellular tyrosine-protein kinase PKDCC-like [Ischnura elegans]|uniref:extracellular tyrosine-protein kinase PKDCC-like n=1 Tax=Ischnura elegans TaxID=197161 RepID=UPI001ED8781B|nr:extracellular tyrosine-protein kinase PKDCC-like [Ischnura elegans]
MTACPCSAVMFLCIVSYGCLLGMAVALLFWPGFELTEREEATLSRACEGIGRRQGRPAAVFGPVFRHPLTIPTSGVGRGAADIPLAHSWERVDADAKNESAGERDDDFLGGGGDSAGVRDLECSAVYSATDLEFVAGGWTKAVYKARVWGHDVAIKTVNLNGLDFRECRRGGGSLSSCYRRAAVKILREMVLLRQLRHENIVQVLGSCIPDASSPVAMVTELGDPLNTVSLLQLSWEDRLKMSLGMARILHLLAHSPLGSLAMNEFRRHQFVLVGRTTLKLSDVDDVGVTEPSCVSSDDCLQRLPSEMQNNSYGVKSSQSPCIKGRCVGHNEKLNVWHAGRHFIRLFLPPSAPYALEPHIQELLEAYKTARWNSEQILEATKRLVTRFVPDAKLRQQQSMGHGPDIGRGAINSIYEG